MAIGEAIRLVRHRKGWTQGQLAARIPTHPRNVGHWENGTNGRCPDLAALIRMVSLFDDVEFTLAVVRHVTGGLFGSVAPGVCGIRTAAAIAMSVELEELRADLARVKSDLLKDPLLARRETLESVFSNILDVQMVCNQLLIELSRDYGLSLREMQRHHLEEMQAKGYIGQKKSRLRSQAA